MGGFRDGAPAGDALLDLRRPIPLLRPTVCCLQSSKCQILFNPKLRRLQTRGSAPPAQPALASQARTSQPMIANAVSAQEAADGGSSSSALPNLRIEDLESLLSLMEQQPQADVGTCARGESSSENVEFGQSGNVATLGTRESGGRGSDRGAWFDEAGTWRGNPRRADNRPV